jgi:hypothetical protein
MPLSETDIHLAGRIDQDVRDYFIQRPTEVMIPAMDLMPLFIEKEIFAMDYSRPGWPIRNLLRQLDEEHKLAYLKHIHVVRHKKYRNWFFSRVGIWLLSYTR